MSRIERIEDLSDQTFNPYLADDAVFGDMEDPYSVIQEIRREGPVVAESYLVSGKPASSADAGARRGVHGVVVCRG
jgi:hypothetical protein